MTELAERTAQDLLAERRENVLELMRETDEIARALLEFHIAEIDYELASRRAGTGLALVRP